MAHPVLMLSVDQGDTWLPMVPIQHTGLTDMEMAALMIGGADHLVLAASSSTPPERLVAAIAQRRPKVRQVLVALRRTRSGSGLRRVPRDPEPELNAFTVAQVKVILASHIVLATSTSAPTRRLQQVIEHTQLPDRERLLRPRRSHPAPAMEGHAPTPPP